jgi:type IV pilus assembly protein PilX
MNNIYHPIKKVLPPHSGKLGAQQGAVLIVSLIILLLMTIIGVTASKVTSLEEKMAGNMRDRNLAFQAAESALSEGETWLKTNAFSCNVANGQFLPQDKDCNADTAETAQVWDSIGWNTTDSTDSVEYSGVLSNLNAKPRYIIEFMGTTCTTIASPCPLSDQRPTFRVTSRAVGGSTDTVVMLQSIFQI